MRLLNIVFCVLFPYMAYATMNCSGHVDFISEIYKQFDTAIKQHETHEEKVESIKEIIAKNIDSRSVAEFVLRDYWKDASTQQKSDFVDEYNKYITKSYASLIEKYFGKMEIVSTRSIKTSQCAINSRFMYKDSPLYISYFTVKRSDDFQIYDVAFEGVRTTITHRDQFKSVLPKLGLDGLIKSMQEKE